MLKLLAVMTVVLTNAMLYCFLAGCIRRWPEHSLPLALCFCPVKATGAKIFEKILSSDFDKCIPFAFYLDVMNAVFPSLILPSAVTFTTLCLVLMLE